MESQQHGFEFERQVVLELSKKYILNNEVSYTDRWDCFINLEKDFLPVQIKSFNIETKVIEFGSAERIFSIDENFVLVLVGYEQCEFVKKPIFSCLKLVEMEELKKFKGELCSQDIKNLVIF